MARQPERCVFLRTQPVSRVPTMRARQDRRQIQVLYKKILIATLFKTVIGVAITTFPP